jgi:hypothetical protein
MQRAQAIVGGEKTPVGIVMYSDKTHALQNMQCYPVYRKYPRKFKHGLFRNSVLLMFYIVWWAYTCMISSFLGEPRQQNPVHKRWLAAGWIDSDPPEKAGQLQREDNLRESKNSDFSWY